MNVHNGAPSPMNILVVDDSQVVRSFFERILRQAGQQVTTATNGHEALRLMHDNHYDVVLLDLYLPDTDGLEVLTTLRKTDQETCVLLVTGHSDVQSAIAAGQLGADGYAEKEEVMGTGATLDKLFHRIDQAMTIRNGRRAAIELERIRSELYAMVSHDLRNPINIIQLAASMLGDRLNMEDTESQNLVSMITTNTDNLVHQLNDFLDFARLDTGGIRLTLEETDIVAMVSGLVGEMRMLADQRGHDLRLRTNQATLPVRIDVRRMRQALSNLIENAIKYSPQAGKITVGLLVSDHDYVVMVSDTGIGVPADQQNQLFQRYMRARNAETSKIKGTGLGLMIVRQIAETHGGRVWYRSNPGGGSVFGMTLPR